ncbi:MAG TPA: UDP-N-acetylmuramoyl-L-alanine--D-glutamate ligase [Myxococcota bacterium]|nr:UDP-N-acetylmuramoyl-L-alanine--D-glutamate ligase [Myxococcota bacterium]
MRSLSGARVTVLGAARSGRAAAELALRFGAIVVLSDLREDLDELPGATCVFGHHRNEDLVGADLVVVSPGVPAAAPPVRKAIEAGVEVVGELGFAASFIDPGVSLLAVTGTNGKSTVTHFTAQLLEAAGARVFAGGNLGTPLSKAVGLDADVLVVEVSSYQMELPGCFAPSAAVVLNLTPDHLGRHKTMEGYAEAKCRVFDRIDEGGFAILPAGDELLASAARGRGGRRVWLGAQPGATIEGDELLIGDGCLDLTRLEVPGEHNRWNAAAASLLAVAAGRLVEDIDLAVLSGLPHRLELVAEIDGVRWINDSKATNIDAAAIGIKAMNGELTVLLGGQGKEGVDWASLPVGGARVICFGASGAQIQAAVGGERVLTLQAAVERAREVARAGTTVLLSPACASFDEFNDFEHRGVRFKEWVG